LQTVRKLLSNSNRKLNHVLGVDTSATMISNCVAAPNADFRQIPDITQTALPDINNIAGSDE
jgi:hypothetical protein